MERWSGRVALVTGASAGIGAAISRALVTHGVKVVACARRVDRIQKIADELKDGRGLLKGVKCDLRKEEDILAMFQQIRSDPDLGGVDVCVNNAGLSHDDSLLEGKTEEWRELLEINVLAVCICTRETFKSMKERCISDGHILVMNSLAGHRTNSNKNNHFYSATKHAVTAITKGLRFELREAMVNTKVTSITPGFVETEFLYSMLKDEERARKAYRSFNYLQTSDVVDAVLYALSTPPNTQIDDVILRPIHQAT